MHKSNARVALVRCPLQAGFPHTRREQRSGAFCAFQVLTVASIVCVQLVHAYVSRVWLACFAVIYLTCQHHVCVRNAKLKRVVALVQIGCCPSRPQASLLDGLFHVDGRVPRSGALQLLVGVQLNDLVSVVVTVVQQLLHEQHKAEQADHTRHKFSFVR